MQAEHARAFELFGTRVAIHLGAQTAPGMLPPPLAAISVEALLRKLNAELTRFDPASPLTALNEDPATTVAVTPHVALLVEAAVGAATTTDGLVDPTLIGALEACGYAHSRAGEPPAPLADALRAAPAPATASPAPGSRWREISIDRDGLRVTRPPGVRIDSGGVGKGLAADLAARRLSGYTSFCVDCGGDLRLGGSAGRARRVSVENPLAEGEALAFELATGGVATSGLRTRIWRHGKGFAHHLIDPATGRPAWTGLVQATALAPTALAAEALAKAALLAGPEGARRRLADHGGVLIHDSGEIEAVGIPAPAVALAEAA